MAHNDSVIMDATLRALVEQQEEILKCVQWWQTGHLYSIVGRLGRLDEKMDQLLSSGLCICGAATGGVRISAEGSAAGVPSDGLVQDGMSATEIASDFAGGALQRKASLRTPTASSGDPGTCSRSDSTNGPHRAVSFNFPHCISEAIDEDDVRAIESPADFAGGPFQRKALPQAAFCGEPTTCSRSNAINVPPCTASLNLPHCVSEATDAEVTEKVIDEEASASFPVPRLSPPSSPSYMTSGSTARRRYSGKSIIKKSRQDLVAQQPRLVRVTQSAYFEVFGSALIILNVLSICWQTQIAASRVEDAFVSGTAYSDSVPALFVAMQSFFTLFFVLEVGMRWAATGFTRFVCNGDWKWNTFDILIVSAGLLQQFSEYLQTDAGMGGIVLVRCLRILRLLRVFRSLRYYAVFRELRMLINTCLGGLMSYIWFCCINFLLALVFGITLTTRTYTYIMTSEQYADDEDARLLQGFFGTIDKSIVSLVQASFGGRDWHELYELLRMVGAVDCLLLLCFLSFSMYVLGNAGAAIFVEGAMTYAQYDTEFIIKQQLDRDFESRKKLLDVFEELDSDGNGALTLEEFSSQLQDDRVIAYFDAFQLDVGYAPQVFSLLDVDGSGYVDIQEFIDGCIKLKGEARQLKLYEIQHSMSSIDLNLRRINRFLEKWPLPNAMSMHGAHEAPSTGRRGPGCDVPELPWEGLSQAP